VQLLLLLYLGWAQSLHLYDVFKFVFVRKPGRWAVFVVVVVVMFIFILHLVARRSTVNLSEALRNAGQTSKTI